MVDDPSSERDLDAVVQCDPRTATLKIPDERLRRVEDAVAVPRDEHDHLGRRQPGAGLWTP